MSRSLPGAWRQINFGEIARDVSERNRDRHEIPVLSVTKYDGFVPSEEYFKKKVFSADTENYKIVRRGQFAYATIHLDEGSIDRLTKFDAGLISPMYTVFQLDESEADPEFVLRLFKLFSNNGRFDALGNGGVNRRKSISFSTLSKLELALPPLHEQRRIAEILSSVDDTIAATRAVIEQTRKLKQGVLERLLTKGIGHTSFKQTEIGEIPEGWEVKELVQIAAIDRGRFSVRPRNDPRYFGGDIPFVQTGDVVASEGRLIRHSQTLNQLGAKVSREFPSGTILITIAANIGDTAITTYPVCCPDSVVGIVPNASVNADWLREFLVLQKPDLDRQATRNAQKNINLQHLRPILVPVAPCDEQEAIGRRVRDLHGSQEALQKELSALESLKSALTSDLLTGRKCVTDALPMAAE